MLNGNELFKSLHAEAVNLGDPCANFITFTTVDAAGKPHSRTLTVRSVKDSQIVVGVNSDSPKMHELKSNHKWELSGFWPVRMVQFRIRGSVVSSRPDSLREGWKKKNTHSRLADIYQAEVREQSSILENRAQLLSEISTLAETANLDAIPESLIALEFSPNFYEIWIGSEVDRLPDRTVHRLIDGSWETEVLVP